MHFISGFTTHLVLLLTMQHPGRNLPRSFPVLFLIGALYFWSGYNWHVVICGEPPIHAWMEMIFSVSAMTFFLGLEMASGIMMVSAGVSCIGIMMPYLPKGVLQVWMLAAEMSLVFRYMRETVRSRR